MLGRGGDNQHPVVVPHARLYYSTAMTSINLKTEAIDKWMYSHEYVHGCKDISEIYIVTNDDDTASIKSRSQELRPLTRTVNVTVETDGESILSAECNCPVAERFRPGYHRCKHVQKALYRIRDYQVTSYMQSKS